MGKYRPKSLRCPIFVYKPNYTYSRKQSQRFLQWPNQKFAPKGQTIKHQWRLERVRGNEFDYIILEATFMHHVPYITQKQEV